MRVLSESDCRQIWRIMYEQYCFRPQFTEKSYSWINPPLPFKVFILPDHCWNAEQEKLVNSFFVSLSLNELYALDWEHDCFIYDPREEIPLYYEYPDELRQCTVYFPSYYSNGDYYFFSDIDWKYGLFGHPWLGEIVVTGKELIQLFDDNSQTLGITVK